MAAKKSAFGKKKVFCLGELLLDIFAEEITTNYSKVKRFLPFLGGGSANVAACLARQGVDSAFISLVGSDPIGDMLIAKLKENGVDTSYIKRTEKYFSGLVFVSRDKRRERYFLPVPDKPSCLLFNERDITPAFLSHAVYLHFGSSNLVNISARRATMTILKECKRRNILVSFDLNLRPGNWKMGKIDRRPILEAMKYADILKANENELLFIADGSDRHRAAMKIAKNIPLVFISLGERGAEAYCGGRWVAVPSVKVRVEDTTGAGDAFCAGYLAAFYRMGLDASALRKETFSERQMKLVLKEAVRLGGAVVRKLGAVTACPVDKE
ncbi:MAG: aminoimidazole riboside kinase [Myxococcota bacterium]